MEERALAFDLSGRGTQRGFRATFSKSDIFEREDISISRWPSCGRFRKVARAEEMCEWFGSLIASQRHASGKASVLIL